MDCAVDDPSAPGPSGLFGKIAPFCGASIRSFRLPEREADYVGLSVGDQCWQDLLWCFTDWARVFWLPGDPHRIWVLSSRRTPEGSCAFYAILLLLATGRDQVPVKIESARLMNFDECVDFLLCLHQEMRGVDGKVRPRVSTKGRQHRRIVWVGPAVHERERELQAICAVFGTDLKTAYATQDVRQFRRQLDDARSAETVFLWECHCGNLGAIARLKFADRPVECCNEWEWDNMFLLLKFWLEENAQELGESEVEGAISSELLQKRLGDAKVLCISPQRRTDIKTTLQRSGFPEAVIDMCFHEEKIEFGENSNLMQTLEKKADSYGYLLYSSEGLRHTSSAVEQKFGDNLFKGRTARNVVDQFKRHILTPQRTE